MQTLVDLCHHPNIVNFWVKSDILNIPLALTHSMSISVVLCLRVHCFRICVREHERERVCVLCVHKYAWLSACVGGWVVQTCINL